MDEKTRDEKIRVDETVGRSVYKPSNKSRVAVLKTRPETVVEDYKNLMRMVGYDKFLKKGKTTILKNNISWHFPYPGANTTPWQMEAVIQCLKEDGYEDIVCVENKTVVTNAYKGEKLNKYVNIFKNTGFPFCTTLGKKT